MRAGAQMRASSFASRKQYSESVHEFQEIGRKITILGNLLSLSPTAVWMSSDRESVLFGEEKGVRTASTEMMMNARIHASFPVCKFKFKKPFQRILGRGIDHTTR